MMGPLDIIDTGVQGFGSLDVTHNLAAQMQNYVVGAFARPLPSTDPMSAYRYLNSRRQVLQDAAKQRPLIRMQDKNLNQLAVIGSEISCVAEEIATDSGEATVVIRGGDYLGDFVRNLVRIEEDLHLSIDPQATQPSWKTRWGGKITTVNVKRDSSGIHTVELIATSNREHLKTTLIAANPIFPPEIQIPKMWFIPANCRTACAVTLWIQFARAFFPFLSIPTNIFNPFGWVNPLNPDALLNFNPLHWPLQVQFVNPILDQSRTSLLAGAWVDFHSASHDIMKDAGVCARAYTYFTEDEDNPHPELEAVVGQELADFARPQRNAVVVAFEDHSGHGGPTGTAFDGVINLFASTLDDLITTTVFPVNTTNDPSGVDPIFQKLFMVAPPPPWAIYRDGQESGIIESGYFQHKGPVRTTMTGGHSPKLVNDLQCVAGDTIIEGPDGDERIDVLAAEGKPFRVWSVTPEGLRVPAKAIQAFKKGTAELFEYRLQDGRAIKATQQHRFLTRQGFIAGSGIDVGSEVATVDHPTLGKGLDLFPIRHPGDSDFVGIHSSDAVKFRKVVSVESVGVDDFYDMTVPGWGNYSANGFWNHNTFAIRFAISQLAQVVLGVEAPAVEGLDNIYQGQLDDILFAWQRYTNPLRALYTGDVAYLEHFERGGGTAYTISGVLTLRQGDWKKRAYRSFKTSIRNAAPFIINYDILLDDRVGFEVDGLIYVDQVSAIKYEYDRKKPVTYTVSVGDDAKDQDPLAQGIRALQAVYSLAGLFLGEGTLFG